MPTKKTGTMPKTNLDKLREKLGVESYQDIQENLPSSSFFGSPGGAFVESASQSATGPLFSAGIRKIAGYFDERKLRSQLEEVGFDEKEVEEMLGEMMPAFKSDYGRRQKEGVEGSPVASALGTTAGIGAMFFPAARFGQVVGKGAGLLSKGGGVVRGATDVLEASQLPISSAYRALRNRLATRGAVQGAERSVLSNALREGTKGAAMGVEGAATRQLLGNALEDPYAKGKTAEDVVGDFGTAAALGGTLGAVLSPITTSWAKGRASKDVERETKNMLPPYTSRTFDEMRSGPKSKMLTEEQVGLDAWSAAKGKQEKTAKALGIKRMQLEEKLQRDLKAEGFKSITDKEIGGILKNMEVKYRDNPKELETAIKQFRTIYSNVAGGGLRHGPFSSTKRYHGWWKPMELSIHDVSEMGQKTGAAVKFEKQAKTYDVGASASQGKKHQILEDIRKALNNRIMAKENLVYGASPSGRTRIGEVLGHQHETSKAGTTIRKALHPEKATREAVAMIQKDPGKTSISIAGTKRAPATDPIQAEIDMLNEGIKSGRGFRDLGGLDEAQLFVEKQFPNIIKPTRPTSSVLKEEGARIAVNQLKNMKSPVQEALGRSVLGDLISGHARGWHDRGWTNVAKRIFKADPNSAAILALRKHFPKLDKKMYEALPVRDRVLISLMLSKAAGPFVSQISRELLKED